MDKKEPFCIQESGSMISTSVSQNVLFQPFFHCRHVVFSSQAW